MEGKAGSSAKKKGMSQMLRIEQIQIFYCESPMFSDEMIAAIVEEHSREGAIVGIDAPLIVNKETGAIFRKIT